MCGLIQSDAAAAYLPLGDSQLYVHADRVLIDLPRVAFNGPEQSVAPAGQPTKTHTSLVRRLATSDSRNPNVGSRR